VKFFKSLDKFSCTINGFIYSCKFKLGEEVKHFRAAVLNRSDLMFEIDFQSALREDEKEGLIYKKIILIGSCGSKDWADMGKIFQVSAANKKDSRGRWIKSTSNIKSRSIQLLRSESINDSEIATGDHVYQVADNTFPGRLFDMETFGFYQICKVLQIEEYFCLRFVTDKVNDNETEFYSRREYYNCFIRHHPCGFIQDDKILSVNPDLLELESYKKVLRLFCRIKFDCITMLMTSGGCPNSKPNQDHTSIILNCAKVVAFLALMTANGSLYSSVFLRDITKEIIPYDD